MDRIPRTARRASLTIVATVAMVFALSLVGAPGAGAAADCSASRFINPDGSLDTTGYLQCTSPSVSDDIVAPGGTIVFKGGGFAADSTVTITFFSQPQVLGTTTTDSSGNFEVQVTIPSDAEPGAHRLEASGVDPDGNPLVVSKTITVASDGEVLGTVQAATPSGSLPYTGSDVGRTIGVALAAVAVGGAAVWGARRARAARTTS